MKNQVLSIEQMKRLQKLGVDTSKASLAWWRQKDAIFDREWHLGTRQGTGHGRWHFVPTFTLQDMLEMISGCFNHEYEFKFMYHLGTWYSKYMPMIDDDDYFIISNTSPLICAYETLCWLAENKHIGGEK